MPRKTFVYPHPINAYIIKQLGITVEEFCELHAFSQGTVSSWITGYMEHRNENAR